MWYPPKRGRKENDLLRDIETVGFTNTYDVGGNTFAVIGEEVNTALKLFIEYIVESVDLVFIGLDMFDNVLIAFFYICDDKIIRVGVIGNPYHFISVFDCFFDNKSVEVHHGGEITIDNGFVGKVGSDILCGGKAGGEGDDSDDSDDGEDNGGDDGEVLFHCFVPLCAFAFRTTFLVLTVHIIP